MDKGDTILFYTHSAKKNIQGVILDFGNVAERWEIESCPQEKATYVKVDCGEHFEVEWHQEWVWLEDVVGVVSNGR